MALRLVCRCSSRSFATYALAKKARATTMHQTPISVANRQTAIPYHIANWCAYLSFTHRWIRWICTRHRFHFHSICIALYCVPSIQFNFHAKNFFVFLAKHCYAPPFVCRADWKLMHVFVCVRLHTRATEYSTVCRHQNITHAILFDV